MKNSQEGRCQPYSLPPEKFDVWRRMIAAQGGDPDAPLPTPRETHVVTAPTSGVLTSLDALAVGVAAWRLVLAVMMDLRGSRGGPSAATATRPERGPGVRTATLRCAGKSSPEPEVLQTVAHHHILRITIVQHLRVGIMRGSDQQSQHLTVVYRPTGELTPDPRNARTHPKSQIAQLRSAIDAFGFTNPILVDEAGVLLSQEGEAGAELLAHRLLKYQPARKEILSFLCLC